MKVCGLTTEAAVEAAAETGVDAAGFVFSPSPRQLTAERAAALAERLPDSVVRVAVFRHPAPGEVARVLHEFAADWVQTDAADLAGQDLAGAEPVAVLRAGGPTPVVLPGLVLFEGAESGAGEVTDWDAAEKLARQTRVILAGGLDAANVADAVASVRPWGIDVSSGVEIRRGEKDPARMAAFVAAARRAAEAIKESTE
ncbi:MAG: phosphoribosylanthranilate isomerase [Gammaproteobacteria bacterium]